MKNIHYYIPVIFLLFVSCGKGDRIAPEINITLPAENQVFKSGQSVNIKANIRDNYGIQSMHLNVIDSSSGATIYNLDEFPNENAYNLNTNFNVLHSKKYIIQIEVTDYHENFTKKEVSISVN